MRVVVVGGGVAGLLAAWCLVEQGWDVEVWEADRRPGGWVWTETWPREDGRPGWLERGPQELSFGPSDALAGLVRRLDVTLQASPPRAQRWVLREGQRHPMPRSLRDLLGERGIAFSARLRLALEPWLPKHSAPDLKTFLIRRLGQDVVDTWIEPWLRSLVPSPLERVGLEAIPGLATWQGSLWRFWRAQEARRTWIPVGGMGALSSALAARLGTRLGLNRPVLALSRTPRGWAVRGPEGVVEVDRVVVAVPPVAAAALLEPVAPEAATRLRTLTCVDLLSWHSRHLGTNPWPKGVHGVVAPGEDSPIVGVLSVTTHAEDGGDEGLQLRTYVVGAGRGDWASVEAALKRWLPELPPAHQVTAVPALQGFCVPAPGHGRICREIDEGLPPGIAWTGSGRLGASLLALVEGFPEGWNPFEGHAAS